ncbi:MAG: T9SS type A sorting domain-containing protein [Bacteroidales bacterium]|nr:T9SS type A sorting domain-containing protein [Bacteroidales bacterium]
MNINFNGFFRFRLFLFTGILFISYSLSQGAEFVIMNRVISWDINAGDAFWSFKPNATMPGNWLSPYNYYDGKIYTRYEVVGVATDIPFGVQFDLFQWKWDTAGTRYMGELCENVRWLNNGVGTIVESSSSPSTWWKVNGGVDFSKISDLQSMSITIWCNDPQAPISKAGEGGDDDGIAWSKRFNWFPVSVRVTVVAVSQGSVFSGWNNYVIDPALQKPTPAYGIDYINETTDKVVPATDEYSMFPQMTYATSGTGEKVSLTPGRRYYFRTKAGDGLLVSPVQILVVPERPATPTFTVDVANHRTSTVVNNTYEYSENSDMSGALTGTGNYVEIPAGQTRYFRKMATGSSFRSNMQSLNESSRQPVANEFVIFNGIVDYPNGTDTNGFYYFWHNADMPVNWLTPVNYYNGEVYMRYEILSQKTSTPVGLQFGIWQQLLPETGETYETMSEIATLGGAGSIAVTHSSPASWWKYNRGIDFTRMNLTWHFGINPWKVSPSNYQIRQENASVWNDRFTYWYPMKVYVTIVAVAKDKTFSGWENYLGVKPATPAYTFSYSTMEINQVVPSADEYSYSPTMVPAYTGTGTKISVTPGQDIYFRTRAQGIYTASDIQHLVIPARPATPSFAIDFYEEKTTVAVSPDFEYAYTADMSGAVAGNGSKLDIVTGTTVYFRKPQTSGSFASLIQTLAAPARPATPSYTIHYATARTNENIASTDDYSTSPEMTDPVAGTNTPLDLIPGTGLYFRTRATSSSFISEVQFLEVKCRPVAPSYTIDYISYTTNETVASNIEVSEHTDISDPMVGTGEKWSIEPGKDLYFRQMSDTASFSSDVFHLAVPGRNSLDYYGPDTITENKIVLRAHIVDVASSFSLDDLMIANGTAQNLRAGNVFDVYADTKGYVVVTIPANAVSPNSFASNVIKVYYDNTQTGTIQKGEGDFGVYPNPSYDGIVQIRNPLNTTYILDIINVSGALVKTFPLYEGMNQQLNLSDLQKGMYFLKFRANNTIAVHKLILE